MEEKATTKKRSKQVDDRSISEEFGPYADLYKEYKEAEKRGETGISLEKKLFALEDAMEFPEAFDKKAKKRYERLRELEDKGFINYVAKGHFTEHPFSAISPEYELKFLATAADNPKLSEKSYAIDRYNAFQKKIIDNSIDPNNITRPKSDNAIKWKQDMENAYRKVHDTLDEKVTDVDYNTHLKIDKLIRDFDSKYKNSIENPTEWNKVTKKIEKLYNSPEYLNTWKEFDDAFDVLKNVYKDKLIEVVLKDLDIPINSKNKAFIINSQLINFAPLDDY